MYLGSLIFLNDFIRSYPGISFDIRLNSVVMPLKDAAGGGFSFFPTTYQEWTDVLPNFKLSIDSSSVYSMLQFISESLYCFICFKVVIEGCGGPQLYEFNVTTPLKMIVKLDYSRYSGHLLSFRWLFVELVAVWIYLGTQITIPRWFYPLCPKLYQLE